MNDITKQIEESIKKGIEASANMFELNGKYSSEYAQRNNLFWAELLDLGVKNTEELSQCTTVVEAYEKQVAHSTVIKTKFEQLQTANNKAFESAKASFEKITATLVPEEVAAPATANVKKATK
jgi:hypothetical protein